MSVLSCINREFKTDSKEKVNEANQQLSGMKTRCLLFTTGFVRLACDDEGVVTPVWLTAPESSYHSVLNSYNQDATFFWYASLPTTYKKGLTVFALVQLVWGLKYALRQVGFRQTLGQKYGRGL